MVLTSAKIEIIGEKVILRPVSIGCLDEIYKNFTPTLTKYMYPDSPKNKDETKEFILRSAEKLQAGTDINFTITRKSDGEFLGGCGLHNINTQVVEPGIWIKESEWGRGYGKEAVHLAVDWARKNLKLSDVVYPVCKENIGSRKIAESLRGVVVKEYQTTTASGKVLEMVEYRVEVS